MSIRGSNSGWVRVGVRVRVRVRVRFKVGVTVRTRVTGGANARVKIRARVLPQLGFRARARIGVAMKGKGRPVVKRQSGQISVLELHFFGQRFLAMVPQAARTCVLFGASAAMSGLVQIRAGWGV